jgi:SAM-dependent methyltransferase
MTTPQLEYLEKIRIEELGTVVPGLPEGTRLLDFGAGLGFQALRLKECGFDVKAVDVMSPHAVTEIVFPVEHYDGRILPYADRSFDVVFSSNVLEHVTSLEATMEEVTRVLRPGGIMIHVLPSASWRWWTTIAEFIAIPFKIRRCLTLPVGQLRLGHILPRWLAILAEACGQMVRPFLFIRHGERGNALTELYLFSRPAWRRCFKSLGLEIRLVEASGVFYTGEVLLGSRLPIRTRRQLARYLGSSTFVWQLVPSRAHC